MNKRRYTEKDKLRQKQYRQVNREKVRAISRKSARKLRLIARGKALELLGGRCVICGFSDSRALEIDHINPIYRRTKHIEPCQKTYKDVISGIAKEGDLQLLCANCHAIKTREDLKSRYKKESIDE